MPASSTPVGIPSKPVCRVLLLFVDEQTPTYEPPRLTEYMIVNIHRFEVASGTFAKEKESAVAKPARSPDETRFVSAIRRYAATAAPRRQLTPHLHRLEAESIEILREVAAEFRKPVMLYSIGKDSGVMLHLARKAFFPGPIPFPLLHVDTTWKFREMIAFRDLMARELGLDLLLHVNREGLARGINPIVSGPALHTQVMKTEALKQALDAHGFDAALGGARRDEERPAAPKNGSFRSAASTMSGIRATSARSCGICLTRGSATVSRFGYFRCRTGPRRTCGPTSRPRIFRCCRCISPSRGRWCGASVP